MHLRQVYKSHIPCVVIGTAVMLVGRSVFKPKVIEVINTKIEGRVRIRDKLIKKAA